MSDDRHVYDKDGKYIGSTTDGNKPPIRPTSAFENLVGIVLFVSFFIGLVFVGLAKLTPFMVNYGIYFVLVISTVFLMFSYYENRSNKLAGPALGVQYAVFLACCFHLNSVIEKTMQQPGKGDFLSWIAPLAPFAVYCLVIGIGSSLIENRIKIESIFSYAVSCLWLMAIYILLTLTGIDLIYSEALFYQKVIYGAIDFVLYAVFLLLMLSLTYIGKFFQNKSV